MKLSLVSNDGVVYADWTIEEDFGNVEMPLPRALAINDIFDAIRQATSIEEKAEQNAEADMKRFEK